MTWTRVCALGDLTPDRGVAALVGTRAVAVFRLSPAPGASACGADDEVVAIDNVDPFSGASVLSRGIVGSRGDVVTVASPVYKQRFDLRSGRCLDDPDVAVATVPARIVDGWIEVGR